MSRPLAIAYFTHYADLYGANRSLLDLILPLRDRGEVLPYVYLACDGPIVERLKQERIPHEVLPFSVWMVKRTYMGRVHHRIEQWLGYRQQARTRMQKDRRLLPTLLKSLSRMQVDLLHVNSSVIGIGQMASRAAGIPLIWHVRELPFKHYGLHPDVGHKAFRRALRKADRVIAISKAVRDEVAPGMSTSKPPVVIYNGIIRDQEYEFLRQKIGQKPEIAGAFSFTIIGYFHRSKGQLEGIRAFARVREKIPFCKLLIAGSGNDIGLRQLVSDLGLMDHVTFMGFVNDPDTIYAQTDVLLNCSRFEALGRVTIEAMANGIPVIGHASGGTPEIIEHGSTGYLYDKEDELVKYMVGLGSDPVLARSLGNKAFASIEGKFSVEARATDVLAVYEEVLAGR
jgi:glycosyltransferase involved in cell wall biosynthesis